MVVELKRPWPTTGETDVAFEPTEFLRKLAALMPPPRSHHVRYFGVFAARSGVHHQVRALVPPPPSAASCLQGEPGTHRADPHAPGGPGPEDDRTDPDESKRRRIAWAKLLSRVFGIDVETCPRCAGPMKILAFVTEPRSLSRLLTHAGLPTDIPPIASARAPPQSAWAFEPA